ncbi:MAG: hypothetical protein QM754_18155 [Tepidisphaeraceae bacterium]
MSVLHFPSHLRFDVTSTKWFARLCPIAIRIARIPFRLLGDDYGLISNRLMGQVSMMAWPLPDKPLARPFFDVWKIEPNGDVSDVMAGMTGFRELWKYRASFSFVLRLGETEFTWTTPLGRKLDEARRLRREERRRRKWEDEIDADADAPTQD